MATTIKDLRKFLAKLPDDMEVHVLRERTRGWDTSTEWVPLELPAASAEYSCSNTCGTIGNVLELGER
jgi:hypothetical protein